MVSMIVYNDVDFDIAIPMQENRVGKFYSLSHHIACRSALGGSLS